MKRIITITREYGSGGHEIGKKLAEALGYEFYDKKIVARVAEETGFDEKFIEKHGEHASIGNTFSYLFSGPGGDRFLGGMSTADYMWMKQREVILNIAEERPCVIIGRCSDFILRERADLLTVFVHAPLEWRLERVRQDRKHYDLKGKTPEQLLKEKDRARSYNYEQRTGEEWGDLHQFHVALDSSKIDVAHAVAMLKVLAQ